MKVSKITVKNCLGIESLEFSPGSVTVICGKNGSGKTSILDAIRAAVGGGHDATLLRKGSKQGQIVLELEDGAVITKNVSEERSDLTVELPNIGKVSRKQAYLDSLVDSLGMNPIEFLFSNDKRRIDLLMQSAAVELDAERLREITGMDGVSVASKANPFDVLDLVRRKLYDERTGLNRVAREKRASVAAMQEALPELSETDWDHRTGALEQTLSDLKREANAKLSEAKAKADEREGYIRDEYRRKLDDFRRELEAWKDKELDSCAKGLAEWKEEIKAEYQELIERTAAELGEARTKCQAERDAVRTREFIARQIQESDAVQAQAEDISSRIDRLDALKSELLSGLPIPGLEIRDGQIYVDGLPFDRVNEARRIRIAVDIAKLRAGRLGLLLVDGMERLDETSFREFVGAVRDSGLQAIVCRVDETDLVIKEEVAA